MVATIKFLEHIYSQQCKVGDYIIFSVKGPGIKWRDIPIKYTKNIKTNLINLYKEYPPEKFDLYWSPMPYSKPRRKLENTLDTKFLVQDIDEHEDPNNITPKPSYIWESSPDKYQGLWELDRYIEEPEYTPLNKALAEYIGCDDCFDYTHVYRVPGSINHKYKNKPKVGMPKATKVIYKPKTLSKQVKAQYNQEPITIREPTGMQEREIFARYNIPPKVMNLLALSSLEGIDRSGTIWYIENKLYELGMTPNEIILLVKNSAFNKYRGRADEDTRLRGELEKIISGSIQVGKDPKGGPSFEVTPFGEVMANNETFGGWLVKGFWGRRSHGIVAGMPKCFKSTLAHDLAISVASGKPFLGKFPVEEPGPVILIQNENADYIMKDRNEKILSDRNLVGDITIKSNREMAINFPPDLPIYFINQQGFSISNPDHQKDLEELIKEVKPVLIIFDPLYMMFDGDLNSAQDLNPALNWLLHLKNHYKTSVMLIHHYNKGGTGVVKGGARMMGSITLYGWVESAWYLTKEEIGDDQITVSDINNIENQSTEPAVVTMDREFRMSASFPTIDIHLLMGEMGDPSYKIDVVPTGQKSMTTRSVKHDIKNLLSSSTIPLSVRRVSEALGLSRNQAREVLEELVKDREVTGNMDKGFSILGK